MDIVCPQCNATYRFPESRIPDRRAFFTCKRCNKRLTVEPLPAAGTGPAQAPASTSRIQAASQTGTAHRSDIASEFPEAAVLAPQKYDLEKLLPPDKKGRHNTRNNKSKIKLLSAVHSILDKLLDPDEQVVHIAGATAYYPAEIFFGNGWLTMLYNRYVIAATTKRLVAVNTNARMNKPTHYIFQFPYSQIKKVSRGLLGTSLALTRKKSKRRIFTGIKRALAAEMKTHIASQINLSPNQDAGTLPKDSLCPTCFTPLAGKLAACPKCHALFKSPTKAALRSLLLPGWGDIYLGHRFLGICETLGSLFIWSIFATMVLSGDPSNLAVGLVLLLFYNGMDSLLTMHMAKKGYSLEKKQPQTAPLIRLSTNRA